MSSHAQAVGGPNGDLGNYIENDDDDVDGNRRSRKLFNSMNNLHNITGNGSARERDDLINSSKDLINSKKRVNSGKSSN